MGLGEAIDITFDFRSHTPGWPDKDPDTHSPTLRRYHQLLWSKPLPSGAPFELDVTTPGVYLHPRSKLVDPRSQFGRLGLSSDAVIPSFSRAPDKSLKPIFDQIPEADTEEFNRIGYTIGGMMVWPARSMAR
jgi:hypothetical protein